MATRETTSVADIGPDGPPPFRGLVTECCFTIVRTEWSSLSATGGVAGVERRAALRVDIGYEHMG